MDVGPLQAYFASCVLQGGKVLSNGEIAHMSFMRSSNAMVCAHGAIGRLIPLSSQRVVFITILTFLCLFMGSL